MEGVAEQVEEHATQVLRHHVRLAGVVGERLDELDLEVLVVRARAVVGEPGVLLDVAVEVHAGAVARAAAAVEQHRLDDAVGARAVLDDEGGVALEVGEEVLDLGQHLGRRAVAGVAEVGLEVLGELDREPGEVVDEVERVLDLVRDAGGELPQRGQLFRLHELVLRLAELGQRRLQPLVRGGELLVGRLHLARAFELGGGALVLGAERLGLGAAALGLGLGLARLGLGRLGAELGLAALGARALDAEQARPLPAVGPDEPEDGQRAEGQHGPQRAPPRRLHLHGQARRGVAPDAVGGARLDHEAVVAGAEVGVGRLARAAGLAPGVVEAVEAVAVAVLVRLAKVEAGEAEGHHVLVVVELELGRDGRREVQAGVRRERLPVHEHGRQRHLRRVGVGRRELLGLEDEEPAGPAEVERAVGPARGRAAQAAAQRVRAQQALGERLGDGLEAGEPAARREPQEAVVVLGDGRDEVAGEVARGLGVGRRLAVGPAVEEAGPRADPERAVVRRAQRHDGRRRQAGRLVAEAGEAAVAEQPADAHLRAHPDRAVGRLGDGLDHVRRHGGVLARGRRVARGGVGLAVVEEEPAGERADPEAAAAVLEQALDRELVTVGAAERRAPRAARADLEKAAALSAGPDAAVGVAQERPDRRRREHRVVGGEVEVGERAAVDGDVQAAVGADVQAAVVARQDREHVVARERRRAAGLVAQAADGPAGAVEPVEPAVGRHPQHALAVLVQRRDAVVDEGGRVAGVGGVDGRADGPHAAQAPADGAGPDAALGVFEHARHHARGAARPQIERVEGARPRVEGEQPLARGADEQRAVGAGRDGHHVEDAGGAVAEDAQAVAVQEREPVAGAEPERAVRRGVERADVGVRQAADGARGAVGLEGEQALRRAHPGAVVRAGRDREHVAPGERLDAEHAVGLGVVAVQARRRAHPDVGAGAGRERLDDVAGQRGGVAGVVAVADDVEAVVAVEAVGRADPDEAEGVLGDGVDGRVGEPGLDGEVLEDDLVRGRLGGRQREVGVGRALRAGVAAGRGEREGRQRQGQSRRLEPSRERGAHAAAATSRSISSATLGGTDENRSRVPSSVCPTTLA